MSVIFSFKFCWIEDTLMDRTIGSASTESVLFAWAVWYGERQVPCAHTSKLCQWSWGILSAPFVAPISVSLLLSLLAASLNNLVPTVGKLSYGAGFLYGWKLLWIWQFCLFAKIFSRENSKMGTLMWVCVSMSHFSHGHCMKLERHSSGSRRAVINTKR